MVKPAPTVLYEDEDIVAIDKPAGMPSTSQESGPEDSLAAWLTAKFPGQKDVGTPDDAGLVHRLDNDTSGLTVAAKDPQTYGALRDEFSSGKVKKRYLALVLGVAPENGEVSKDIAHHPAKKKKMVVCESAEASKELKGRPAYTSFKAKNYYRGKSGRYTLLEVEIGAGQRHQIRAHLASIGHPIAGDSLYQNPRKRSEDETGLARQFLHSWKLRFAHPATGEDLSLECPLSHELDAVLGKLRRV